MTITRTITVVAGVFAPGYLGGLTGQVPFELDGRRRGCGGGGLPAQAGDEGVEAGGEPLVAVVGPGVCPEGGQRGEAAGRQGTQEGVHLASGGGALDALPSGRGLTVNIVHYRVNNVARKMNSVHLSGVLPGRRALWPGQRQGRTT
jgi:hypothetical protein